MNTDPNALIHRIYEAAVLPEGWSLVLHEMAAAVDAAGAGLLIRRSDAWAGWRGSPGIDVGLSAYLSSDKSVTSIALPRLVAADHAGFLADHQLFTEDEYMHDPVTVDWATPYGLHRGAATGIDLPGGGYAVVQVQRLKGRPKFEPEALAALDAFRPHIARAVMLAARWRLERLRAMTEALELIGLPAAVLDGLGRALAANTLIEAMTTHVAWLPGDRLGLVDPVAAGMLRQALSSVRVGASPGGRSFPAYGADRTAPVVAHVIPTSGASRELFSGGLGLIVLGSLRGVEAPIVRALYDLTPAETAVAMLLAQGLAPTEIGARRGVSLETVRNQIKALLQKTGANRLGGLIALLARTVKTDQPSP